MTAFRNMTVQGETITADQQKAVAKVLMYRGISHKAVQSALRGEGVSAFEAYRAADRMIQNMRKAGIIGYAGGEWHWLKPEDVQ